MSVGTVWLPGPLAIIPSPKALQRLGHDLPDPVTLTTELNRLSQDHGVPARVDDSRQRASLAVYTDNCVLWLSPTKGGDAYRINGAAPKGLKDHERLVKGALLLRTRAAWWPLHDVADVAALARGRGVRFDTSWPMVLQAWRALTDPAPTTALPDHHVRFLDLLVSVIEASRDIETAKLRDAEPLPYRHRVATREPRFSARGVYDFELLRAASLQRATVVYLDGQPMLRGRVLDVRDRTVTVRFESTVDFEMIPDQGGLRELPSDRVYAKQLEAVELIRRGRAAYDRLLPVLVDGVTLPYQSATNTRPVGSPDPQQLRVFQRTMTVPDMLLVLGPPGTGKTWTITEVIRAYAARGEKVLLTSHTNRAVDNVLERLPPQLRAVRVGNEDALTTGARAYLADVQVETLKRQILAATEGTAARLAAVTDGEAGRWTAHLADRLAAAETAERELQLATAARERAVERVVEPLRDRTAAAAAALARHEAATAAALRALAVAVRDLDRVRSRTGVAKFMLGWLTGPLRRRSERAEQTVEHQRAAARSARAELDTAHGAARVLTEQDPEVARLDRVKAGAARLRDDALAALPQVGVALRAALAPGLPAAGISLPTGRPTDLAGWRQYADALRSTSDLLRRRAELVGDWRGRVPQAGAVLQRELVRYADVVAATCIGTATTELLAETEFDVAIVDEAGQISLPNLLVPLVRARRAVLVGDHQQLPPYLDEDVRRWAAEAQNVDPAVAAETAALLSTSGFERLYHAVDDEHRDMLRVQRRMPVELATFVSRTFYNGQLTTDHPGGGGDPVFHSPFAMVSTADRPPAQRVERRPRKASQGPAGYVNPLEADLIVKLVSRYADWYTDWAVILPYRAQVNLVRDRLTTVLGDPAHVAQSVGTVDSFQGGERDLIVFGFTRSNTTGQVGFLKELRRLNVAISRARRQLVLVGDTDTLENADHQGFRDVMRAMTAYLRHSGDLRTSAAFEAALRSVVAGDR